MGQQFLVLVLVALGFAAGWVARGGPQDEPQEGQGSRQADLGLLDRVRAGAEAALDAAEAAPDVGPEALVEHVDGLEALDAALRDAGAEDAAKAVDDLLNALVGLGRAVARGDDRAAPGITSNLERARRAATRLGRTHSSRPES